MTRTLVSAKMYHMTTTQLLTDIQIAADIMTAKQANEWLLDHAERAMGRLAARGEAINEASVATEMERAERRYHAVATGSHTIEGLPSEAAGRLLVMVSAAKIVDSLAA